MNLSPTLAYCFWHSDENVRIKTIAFFTPVVIRKVSIELDDQPGFTIASWQQRPDSRVRQGKDIKSFEAPEIQPNYLRGERQNGVACWDEVSTKTIKTDALKPYFDYEQYPGEGVQSDDELLQVVKERGTTTFHVMGTCRMGRHRIRQR